MKINKLNEVMKMPKAKRWMVTITIEEVIEDETVLNKFTKQKTKAFTFFESDYNLDRIENELKKNLKKDSEILRFNK